MFLLHEVNHELDSRYEQYKYLPIFYLGSIPIDWIE